MKSLVYVENISILCTKCKKPVYMGVTSKRDAELCTCSGQDDIPKMIPVRDSLIAFVEDEYGTERQIDVWKVQAGHDCYFVQELGSENVHTVSQIFLKTKMPYLWR